MLLEGGAELEHETRGGATALIAAVTDDQREVVLTLLRHGADAHRLTRDGASAVSAAEGKGLSEAYALLMQHTITDRAESVRGDRPRFPLSRPFPGARWRPTPGTGCAPLADAPPQALAASERRVKAAALQATRQQDADLKILDEAMAKAKSRSAAKAREIQAENDKLRQMLGRA